jgi:hypothetical protein
MQTDVENLVCPNCGTTVGQTIRHGGFRAGGTSIGPSAMACPGCDILVYTGQSEWNEKGLIQKSLFIVHRLLWMIVGSIFLAGVFAGFFGWFAVTVHLITPAQQDLCTVAAFFVGALLVSAILIRNAFKEIRDSCNRTASAECSSESSPVEGEPVNISEIDPTKVIVVRGPDGKVTIISGSSQFGVTEQADQ